MTPGIHPPSTKTSCKPESLSNLSLYPSLDGKVLRRAVLLDLKTLVLCGLTVRRDTNVTVIPYKVVREAALNILIHRVWWSNSDVLSVAIFDDRVEFANPGAFPPGTSPESFYKRPQSKPINKLISEVFFKSGLMEAWGRGIPDIFDLCKESGLPTPEFELANGNVYLTIRFAKPLTPRLSGDRGNERETWCLYIHRHREIAALKKMKALDRKGGDKDGCWLVLV